MDRIGEDVNSAQAMARLEEILVEAQYLGLSLRALAADPDFRFSEITATVSEPLIGWARFVDERLRAGERAFEARRPAQAAKKAAFDKPDAFR